MSEIKKSFDPVRDLTLHCIIKASREAVWNAWTDPASFERWWIPAPATCKVLEVDVRPGGALRTQLSEDGVNYSPHMDACFLAADHLERIVFTNALSAGWRPAPDPFMTAVITLADHPEGTEYTAQVMHKSPADRAMHEELGFHEGWGTVTQQLAEFAEGHTPQG